MTVHIDNFGEVVIVECEGRIVSSDAVFALRNAVTAETSARVVVLDLSEVEAIGGGALGMLAFVQRWAHTRGVRLKLFNPSRSVLLQLEQTTSIPAFEFATLDEIFAHLSHAHAFAEAASRDQLNATGETHA